MEEIQICPPCNPCGRVCVTLGRRIPQYPAAASRLDTWIVVLRDPSTIWEVWRGAVTKGKLPTNQ